MKTIVANEQTIVYPRPRIFLGVLEGGVEACTWAVDNYRMTIVYFRVRVPSTTKVGTIASFNHN